MPASVLWQGSTGYTITGTTPGWTKAYVMDIPATTPTGPTAAPLTSLFVQHVSSTSGSGNGFVVRHGFDLNGATMTYQSENIFPDIFTGPYVMNEYHLTNYAVALGGALFINVNLGVSSMGLSDAGVVIAIAIDPSPDMPTNDVPRYTALSGTASPKHVVTSETSQMNQKTGPWITIAAFGGVGPSNPIITFADPSIPVTNLTSVAANGAIAATATYISPYTNPNMTYPTLPPLSPQMNYTWSWTNATTQYEFRMFDASPNPVAVPPLVTNLARSYAQIIG